MAWDGMAWGGMDRVSSGPVPRFFHSGAGLVSCSPRFSPGGEVAAGSEPQPVVVVPRWEAPGSPGGEKVGGESRLLSALPAPPGASGAGGVLTPRAGRPPLWSCCLSSWKGCGEQKRSWRVLDCKHKAPRPAQVQV